eukprot:2724335-Pleurochrysis_carterae.AAC.1
MKSPRTEQHSSDKYSDSQAHGTWHLAVVTNRHKYDCREESITRLVLYLHHAEKGQLAKQDSSASAKGVLESRMPTAPPKISFTKSDRQSVDVRDSSQSELHPVSIGTCVFVAWLLVALQQGHRVTTRFAKVKQRLEVCDINR